MQVTLMDLEGKSKASSFVNDNTVTLKFTVEDKYGIPTDQVVIFLPKKMEACAAMIVGAFNAHMGDETPKEAVRRMYDPGTETTRKLANAIRNLPLDPDKFVLGSTVDMTEAEKMLDEAGK